MRDIISSVAFVGGAALARSNTCILVLTTSNGCVKIAAQTPLIDPDTADTKNVEFCFLINAVFLIISTNIQYDAEKGTSRHSVGARPLQNAPMPSRLAIPRAMFTSDPGFVSACAFVRINSKGATEVAARMRANAPAKRGLTVLVCGLERFRRSLSSSYEEKYNTVAGMDIHIVAESPLKSDPTPSVRMMNRSALSVPVCVM